MPHTPDRVIIRNARQHNLKGITVELPRCGPHGGHRTVGVRQELAAFDTCTPRASAATSSSLSTYAKQFLERMPKPLSTRSRGSRRRWPSSRRTPRPAAARRSARPQRSTTSCGFLWARTGTQHCVKCGSVVKVDTVQEVVDELVAERGTRNAELVAAPSSDVRVPRPEILVTFPLPASAHRPDVEVAAQLRAAGFVRAQLGRRRGPARPSRRRAAGARGTGGPRGRRPPAGFRCDSGTTRRRRRHRFQRGRGRCRRARQRRPPSLFGPPHLLELRYGGPCAHADPVLVQQPAGRLPGCNGFGAVLEYDESLIVPHPGRAWRRARSIRGPSRATRAAVASCARPHGRRESRSTRRGRT